MNLNEFCKQQGLEVCAVKLHFSAISFGILSTYRSAIGNFLYLLIALNSVLISLYSNTIEFIISGDININYLNDNGIRKHTPCYLLLESVVQYNPQQDFIIILLLQLIIYLLIKLTMKSMPCVSLLMGFLIIMPKL
jgi:hypothetical protein